MLNIQLPMTSIHMQENLAATQRKSITMPYNGKCEPILIVAKNLLRNRIEYITVQHILLLWFSLTIIDDSSQRHL